MINLKPIWCLCITWSKESGRKEKEKYPPGSVYDNKIFRSYDWLEWMWCLCITWSKESGTKEKEKYPTGSAYDNRYSDPFPTIISRMGKKSSFKLQITGN